jgi:hypothetical protein
VGLKVWEADLSGCSLRFFSRVGSQVRNRCERLEQQHTICGEALAKRGALCNWKSGCGSSQGRGKLCPFAKQREPSVTWSRLGLAVEHFPVKFSKTIKTTTSYLEKGITVDCDATLHQLYMWEMWECLSGGRRIF